MNNLIAQIHLILKEDNTYKSIDQEMKIHNNLLELFNNNKTDKEFNYALTYVRSHLRKFVQALSARSWDEEQTKLKYEKTIEKSLIFLVENSSKKYNVLNLHNFLADLKNFLSDDSLERLKKDYKLNFNHPAVNLDFLENVYAQKFSSEISKLANEEKLNNLINDFTDFLNKHEITSSLLEKFSEKKNDILIFNMRSINDLKVSEKNIKETFNYIVESRFTKEQRTFLLNSFVSVFIETNLFKNTFAPMNKPEIALYKFFSANDIYRKELIKENIAQNKKVIFINIEKKVERNQNLKIFNKIKLNETQKIELQEIMTKKESSIKKKSKI